MLEAEIERLETPATKPPAPPSNAPAPVPLPVPADARIAELERQVSDLAAKIKVGEDAKLKVEKEKVEAEIKAANSGDPLKSKEWWRI